MRTWLAARQGRPAAPERPHAAAALRAERAPAAGGGGRCCRRCSFAEATAPARTRPRDGPRQRRGAG
eukprot:7326178-Pyramimonas_sp.AAC.1